jgi:N,N'-diacetyllegionaminate synthase
MAKVIAEFCQNHKGDRVLLGEMIRAAAEAGADYAKIQSIRADDLTFRERFEQGADDNGTVRCIKRPFQAEYDRLRPLDLDDETQGWFGEQCQDAGIMPMTTVFTRGAVEFAAKLGWPAVKVASYDCASYPLLSDVRERFQKIFVSTGATHDDEVAKAAALLSDRDVTFLHCVTIYPTPLDQLHLARLNYLRTLVPAVGFSDHTLTARDGLKASIVALALGADVIERHFTILPPGETRDGPVSIDPAGLATLVKFARQPLPDVMEHVRAHIPEYTAMSGQERRELTDAELLNRDYYRGRFATRVDGKPVFNWEGEGT